MNENKKKAMVREKNEEGERKEINTHIKHVRTHLHEKKNKSVFKKRMKKLKNTIRTQLTTHEKNEKKKIFKKSCNYICKIR